MSLAVNIGLETCKNILIEKRQRTVSDAINKKVVEALFFSRRKKNYFETYKDQLKPGHIIRVYEGQEFPADCLLLDVATDDDQHCYVSSGPFDDSTGLVLKHSFGPTQRKPGASEKYDKHLADLISGIIKYEYNYFGQISGTFQLNDNLAADFDAENVVQRGALLTHTAKVICLVLNVGDQCMCNVFKDPKTFVEDSGGRKSLKAYIRKQTEFGRAYKYSIQVFLLSLAVFYLALSFLAVYLSDSGKLSNVKLFEEAVFGVPSEEASLEDVVFNVIGLFCILFSSVSLCFENVVDIIVMMHAYFAEWDTNLVPADLFFVQPLAAQAFGRVSHIFFSDIALQRSDGQSVKIAQVGSYYFANQQKPKKKDKKKTLDAAVLNPGHNEDTEFHENWDQDELSLDYIPNEQKFEKRYYNAEVEAILQGPPKKER